MFSPPQTIRTGLVLYSFRESFVLRITKQADYGIVLMTHFDSSRPGELLSAKDPAQRTALPLPMVSKILKLLTRAGLLHSTRGANGGYCLARPSGDIRLLDMIAALEGPVAMTECSDQEAQACPIESSCRTRVNWKLINQVVNQALAEVTLSQMTTPAPACATLDEDLDISVLSDATPSQREEVL